MLQHFYVVIDGLPLSSFNAGPIACLNDHPPFLILDLAAQLAEVADWQHHPSWAHTALRCSHGGLVRMPAGAVINNSSWGDVVQKQQTCLQMGTSFMHKSEARLEESRSSDRKYISSIAG